ncbi:MAG: recombinase family protein [Candidatus Obscuribacterales bacterium]|nr:recombinase family protein [Candidatus Obscuribacterales bacterium]
MKLAAYTRVSSQSQKDNTSLSVQIERIQGYCVAMGHELASHHSDVETGTGREKRKGFAKALAEIRQGAADGLIVLKLDRYARNVVDGLQVANELRAQGKHLVIVDISVDTSTPMGLCIFTILLAVAELEHSTINERCSSGKAKVRERNGYVHGKPPYGWKAAKVDDRRTLVPVPEQQHWRAKIIEWRECGLAYRQIADDLNELGVPAQMGGPWSVPSVRQICKRRYLLIEWIQSKQTHPNANELPDDTS